MPAKVYSDNLSQCAAKARLEKGSFWPPEAMKNDLNHPTLLALTPFRSRIGPGLKGP